MCCKGSMVVFVVTGRWSICFHLSQRHWLLTESPYTSWSSTRSFCSPANAAAERIGSTVEKWAVPAKRGNRGPAWQNLGLDGGTVGPHLGPWGGPHVWAMSSCCWWSLPLQTEKERERQMAVKTEKILRKGKIHIVQVDQEKKQAGKFYLPCCQDFILYNVY